MDITKIKAAISALPHSSKIQQEDLKNWLRSVTESDPKRIEWHLQRASGVGGSDIGVLLLEAQGLTPPFGRTGVQMASEKMLKSAPSKPLPHMMRGIILEAPLIEAIQRIYGGSRDSYAEELIREANIPNRNGNCDFYWNLSGQRILVDTKVPMSATEQNEICSENHKLFSYKAQLNHYDLLGESQGVKADKMVIAELDVPVELADKWVRLIRAGGQEAQSQVIDQMTILLADETPGMQINFIEVEPDLSIKLYGKDTPLREAIPVVSDSFMEHLINGEPLLAYEEEPLPITSETEQILLDTTQRLGNLRAISEYCDRETSSAQKYLEDHLANSPTVLDTFKGEMFHIKQVTGLDISSALQTLKNYPIDQDELRHTRNPGDQVNSRDLDTGLAIKALRENGLLEACLKKSPFDPEKVSEALTAVGEQPSAHQKSDLTVRKSVTKAAKERFSELAHLTTDIEEFLALRELNAEHAKREEQIEETASSSSMMKVG